MKPADWNDARLRQIGKAFMRDAYDMADHFHTYGADASSYLLPHKQRAQQWAKRGFNVVVPVAFADAVMAILLALPRPEQGSGPRRKWALSIADEMLKKGVGVRATSRALAAETGQPATSIRRRLQELKSGDKSKKPGKPGAK